MFLCPHNPEVAGPNPAPATRDYRQNCRCGTDRTVVVTVLSMDDAITAVPPACRRRLMVTCDGAGASHALIAHLDKLAAKPGYQLIYSAGWELGEREKTAITRVEGSLADRRGSGRRGPRAPLRRRLR